MGIKELGRNYQILLQGLDDMVVKVELNEASFDGRVEHLVNLQQFVAERLRAEIQVKPAVELHPPGSLPVSEGKAKRVIDMRKL
jgi:phenylacetate-CoA ligase